MSQPLTATAAPSASFDVACACERALAAVALAPVAVAGVVVDVVRLLVVVHSPQTP